MRADERERFRVQRRHVDGIANCSLEQRGTNRLRDFDPDTFLCLRGGGTEMRRQDQLPKLSQRGIGGQWFRFKNVECGAGNMAIGNGIR